MKKGLLKFYFNENNYQYIECKRHSSNSLHLTDPIRTAIQRKPGVLYTFCDVGVFKTVFLDNAAFVLSSQMPARCKVSQ